MDAEEEERGGKRRKGALSGGRRPNVLVTGTPGTGKSTLAAAVAAETGLKLVDVGARVRDGGLHEGWDEEFKAHIVDEDKVVDALEQEMSVGGNVVDYHGCGFFPERWFDLVVVLQTENGVLYERLAARGYDEKKLRENIECEIFGVVAEEARESYSAEVVEMVSSNSEEDLRRNTSVITQWYATKNQQQ
eukprot:CAMPEP_0170139490 /NCGR_PEP_ID=MMETSP0033_2-20121228/5693_1 /TAXON_ID=195969 /ORGANISM="Dolichomastix tenuilepis, Strain CCMP3274" /LENGTH=189 /DNA_ID=CAMNT_0010375609 /DNA_START=41 /DNA_END=610 /DNA_ORIENTATION=+